MTRSSERADNTPVLGWFQFSLRGLLLLTALIAVPLGWVAWKRQAAAQRQADVASLRAAGWDVVCAARPSPEERTLLDASLEDWLGIEPLEEVDAVYWLASGCNDDKLELVGQFRFVQRIEVEAREGVTDRGIRALAACRELEALDIRGGVTNASMAELATLTGLRKLVLHDVLVSDRSLPYLMQFEELHELTLTNTAVSPEGFRRIQSAFPQHHASVLQHKSLAMLRSFSLFRPGPQLAECRHGRRRDWNPLELGYEYVSWEQAVIDDEAWMNRPRP